MSERLLAALLGREVFHMPLPNKAWLRAKAKLWGKLWVPQRYVKCFLVYFAYMMVIGIILAVVGLVIFMIAGALMNNAPGVERKHAVIMGIGFLFLMVGLVMTIKAAV